MQVHEANGAKLVDRFFQAGHEKFEFANIDTGGTGSQDVVALSHRTSDGATMLQVINQAGAVAAGMFIAPGGFDNWQLFKINRHGGAAEEIGVGFTRVSDGAAFYRVYRRNGGSLQLVTQKLISGAGFDSHVFRVADFDADGNDEIFVGFNRVSDGVALYQSWEPQTNTLISSGAVTGASFSGHMFVTGNFDGGQAGDEILVGFERTSDGRAFYRVMDEFGTTTGLKVVASNTFENFDWQAINAGAIDLVFLGMQRASDGRPVYVLRDPVAGVAVASRVAASAGFTLLQWATGNFDGNAGNNHEILAGLTRDSDGATVFQTFTQGGAIVGGATALGGNFVNAQFVVIRRGVIHDIYIGGRQTGGQPVIQVWTGDGIKLLSKFIFNSDAI